MGANKPFAQFRYKIARYLVPVICLLFTLSCSTSKPETIYRNEGLVFEPGYPSFSMASYGFYNQDNQSVITVTTEIVPSSFVTITTDTLNPGKKVAGFTIDYRIFKKNEVNSEGPESITNTENKKIVFDGSEEPEMVDNFTMVRNFSVTTPGIYQTVVTVTDQKSQKSKRVVNTVTIPDSDSKEFGLSDIKMSALDSSEVSKGYVPITTYDVTKGYEEIRFESQLTSDFTRDSLEIRSEVIRYRSDNEPADRLSAPPYATSTLERDGIKYDDSEIIFSQSRNIKPGDNIFTYRTGIATPSIGNYRYRLIVKNLGTGNTLIRAFDFGVKREGFPFVRKARDLASSLYYLMNDKEYNQILKIEDPDSIKKAVDDFWIGHIGNANMARDAIELYYSRVEEANKYFSNYKEGWKTDFGMIYILFGPPSYTKTTFNTVRWSYSTNQFDPRYNYIFNQERRKSDVFPFKVYILDRSNPQMDDNEYLIVDKWLSGNILN